MPLCIPFSLPRVSRQRILTAMVVTRFPHYEYVQAKHHSSRRGRDIEVVILHYTAGRGNSAGLAKFFALGNREASAHFGVGRKGDCMQMVGLDRSAWHAGPSKFRGRAPVGWMSVGIEICNTGYAFMNKTPADRIYHGKHRNPAARGLDRWEKYTWPQVEQVQRLLVELKNEIPTLKYVAGHEDIMNNIVRPDRKGSKVDPGPAFPWHVLKTDSIDLERWHLNYHTRLWQYFPEGTVLNQ